MIEEIYLATRHEFGWLKGAMVYGALVDNLEPVEPRTALSLVLLAAGGSLVAGWSWWPRRTAIWAGALVLLVATDLLLFAGAFHPRASLNDLVGPRGD